jgi:NADH:ubiquinone oxidoreductase subunit 4 (subunit M)
LILNFILIIEIFRFFNFLIFNINFSFENFEKKFIIFLLLLIILSIIIIEEKLINLINLKLILLISLFFFLSINLFLIYFFFELSILPILFIILIKGSQIEKLKSSNYLLFYSIFFSIPFLIIIFIKKNQFLFIFLKIKINYLFLIIFLLIFLIKTPLFLIHFWLPKVHVEASTQRRIILAGLLLKFGTFGLFLIIKLIIKVILFKIIYLSLIGLTLINIITIIQRDIKSFLACSSIVHINFLIFNILIIIKIRKFSSFIIIISHGLISTIIFFIIGEIYKFNIRRLIYFIKNIFFNNFKIFLF